MMRALRFMIGVILIAAAPRQVGAQCLPGDPFYNYPIGFQTIPSVIRLVGQTNGVVDPHGDCTMIIRDASNNPAPNVPVTIDFSNCPDIRICTSQSGGTQVGCSRSARSVTRYTDATGRVTFTIIG